MVREELEKKMAVLLGGRAAEHLIFGHLSTGAADDLNKATEIARSMVTRYAMVPELGHVTYDNEPVGMLGPGLGQLSRRDYSNETAREIDGAVRRIVDQAFVWARAILDRNRPLLEEGARTAAGEGDPGRGRAGHAVRSGGQGQRRPHTRCHCHTPAGLNRPATALDPR